SPIRRAIAGRSSLPMVSIAPSAAAQATGFPPNVPPRPPGCTASIISARPVTPAQRQPAGNALGGGDQVGHHTLVVDREPVAGPAEPGLDLVGHEHDP